MLNSSRCNLVAQDCETMSLNNMIFQGLIADFDVDSYEYVIESNT